jgi:transposase
MKPYSLDLRQKIVTRYDAGGISQRQLAKQFGVALSFIQKLLKQRREVGNIAPKVRQTQTPSKLNTEHLIVLSEIVESNNDAILEELQQLLLERTGILISRSTMARLLIKLNLTRKKKALHPSEKGSERVQRLRYEYWQMIQGILAQNLIFIDESGVNWAMTRLYARSAKGQRARGAVPQRGKNVSILGAISLNGLITQLALLGSTDGLTFEAFIARRLVPKLWKGACVVMDNCSIHNDAEIERLIQAAGAQLIYLPPYSPDFSPIENCWSKIKSILRRIGARNHPDLAKAIEEAFAEVSLDDLRGWFTHCCYCTSPA